MPRPGHPAPAILPCSTLPCLVCLALPTLAALPSKPSSHRGQATSCPCSLPALHAPHNMQTLGQTWYCFVWCIMWLLGITTAAAAAAAANQAEVHQLCCIGRCSVYGFCLSAVTSTSKTLPTITLRTTAAAPVTTTIKLGYRYTACAPGQQPYKGAECELGATALDAQGGNLTASVLVCAPATCMASSCASGEASGHLQQCF